MYDIGFANGCFDRLHAGHIYFLDKCKANCRRLIVALNDDISIRLMKGEGRPLDPMGTRLFNVLMNMRVADLVGAFSSEAHLMRLVEVHQPDVIFRGWDQKHDFPDYPMRRFERFNTYSTTGIANGLRGRQ